ncbi:hypothetical protein [Flavobacterium muglaense]|uniref:Uncharacterized protein n=1 Tax=Flavobacterium muglaense TaxID=2764716 RepID=A0A923N4V8_9FLAO|nr:hypothetical protein [Flavobacterium muglaense]MBC5839203.1 hypothetical protein [Flavobacterium muglaense]MBC5845678.1 hypothetical protein [Flavobacterium muglaense]
METIYDHTPTASELLNLADGMTKQQYLTNWMCSKDHSILDIVLLYESRKNEPLAKKYRDLIPDLYQQWQWGLDSIVTSI